MRKFSRSLHVLLILSFLLPFYYTGCQSGMEEEKKAEREKYLQDSALRAEDSLSAIEAVIDSLEETSPLTECEPPVIPTQAPIVSPFKSDSSLSNKLAHNYPFLRPVLLPEKDVSSGLALLIDTGPLIRFFSIVLGLILLLLALLFKFIDKRASLAIFITEFLAYLSVLFGLPISFVAEREWGYWVFAALGAALLIVDGLILRAGLINSGSTRVE